MSKLGSVRCRKQKYGFEDFQKTVGSCDFAQFPENVAQASTNIRLSGLWPASRRHLACVKSVGSKPMSFQSVNAESSFQVLRQSLMESIDIPTQAKDLLPRPIKTRLVEDAFDAKNVREQSRRLPNERPRYFSDNPSLSQDLKLNFPASLRSSMSRPRFSQIPPDKCVRAPG